MGSLANASSPDNGWQIAPGSSKLVRIRLGGDAPLLALSFLAIAGSGHWPLRWANRLSGILVPETAVCYGHRTEAVVFEGFRFIGCQAKRIDLTLGFRR